MVTCVHPGGIKAAVARNATVADGEDQQTFAGSSTTGWRCIRRRWLAKTIVSGVARARPASWSAWRPKPSICSRASWARRIRLVARHGVASSSPGPSRPHRVLERDTTMKTTAGLLFPRRANRSTDGIDLDRRVRRGGKYTAAGLCHSDMHLTDGDLPPRFQSWATKGPGCRRVSAGVQSPSPGPRGVRSHPELRDLRYCTGQQNLCDMGATILEGYGWQFRFHSPGNEISAPCACWAFASGPSSQHSVVKVGDWLPLETAVLVGWRASGPGCGQCRKLDRRHAVIYGVGGLGINAVQGRDRRRL